MAEDLTANPSPKANREFKNSVFTLLFDEEEAIRDISGAVGAMLGEEIKPDTPIKKTTLQNYGGKVKIFKIFFRRKASPFIDGLASPR